MLYVKVDEQGNPVEKAKSYEVVRAIFQAQGTVIPESFKFYPEPFGYAHVPANVPAPPRVAGKKIVAGVPTKNADGTLQRVWIYEDIPNYSLISDDLLDRALRQQRKEYLKTFADTISPLRWYSWSEGQREEVMNWYQSVLAMPDSPEWPRLALPPLPSPLQ